MNVNHPEQQALSDYVSGKLDEQHAAVVETHVAECPECEVTLQAIEANSDTLIAGLRDPEKSPTEVFAREAEYQRAIDQAANLPEVTAIYGAEQTQPSAAPPLPPDAGMQQKLGPYELLAKLGEGGMGAVYQAQHEHLGKTVAIKILPATAMRDPAMVGRFRREMKAVGALHHPNIVGAHDAGEANGVHFLVMEYVAGKDLSTLLKDGGPLPVEQAISCTLQAARGLEFAHRKGIVHRDIKPANLLLDEEGTLKILDMGLARLDDNAHNLAAQEGLTQTGQVMGTVDYMAPEQAFDTHRADAKADVYSLGCTLYRILTGQNAFAGDTIVQKILAHREKPIPSLCAARPDVPKKLDAIFQRMMAKHAEERIGMSEVVQELAALQAAPAMSTTKSLKLPQTPAANAAQPATQSGGGKKKIPGGWLAAGFGAAAVAILLTVVFIIRDKDGKEIARVNGPDGSSVTMNADPGKTADQNKTKSKPVTANSPEYTHDFFILGDGGAHIWATIDKGVPWTKGFPQRTLSMSFDPYQRTAASLAAEITEGKNKALEVRPQILLLQLGGEELAQGVPPETFRENYRSLVSTVRKKYPQAALILAPLRYNDPGRIELFRKYNEALRAAADGNKILYLDLDSAWLDAAGNIRKETINENGTISTHGIEVAIAQLKVHADPILKTLPIVAGIPQSNYALKFEGESSVEVPTLLKTFDPTGPFTIECWVAHNPKTFNGQAPIVGYLNGAPFHLCVNNSKNWDFRIFTKERVYADENDQLHLAGKEDRGSSSIYCGTTSDPRVPHVHLAAVRTEKKLQIFVNGKLRNTREIPPITLRNQNLPFSIGGRFDEKGGWFGGNIDEVRYSNVARYEKDFAPQERHEPDAQTIALYHMDEGTGDILRDASGNGHDGKIVGAKWVRADGTALASSIKQESVANLAIESPTTPAPKEPAPPTSTPPTPKFGFEQPDFAAWAAEIGRRDPETQLAMVLKKLQELNPGYDGQETHRIQNNSVYELVLSANKIADLSPVRALAELKTLKVTGEDQNRGLLKSLAPLAGMKLERLECYYTDVADLAPLRGMPLRDLICFGTRVTDLGPLAGMPLETLWVYDNKELTDLSPLRGTPLKTLACSATGIEDLSPLADCPLNALTCQRTKVKDLGPLRGKEFTELDISFTKVSDLAPLETCTKLRKLGIAGLSLPAEAIEKLQKRLPDCTIKGDQKPE